MPYATPDMPWRLIAAVPILDRDSKKWRPDFEQAQLVMSCKHQVLLYMLLSGRADEYFIPRVWCVQCGDDYGIEEVLGTAFNRKEHSGQ